MEILAMQSIKLYNGVEMPILGFGPGGMGYVPNRTARRFDKSLSVRIYRKFVEGPLQRMTYEGAIARGFDVGFRLLDYSAAYGDGKAVANAIRKSKINRDQLFLTGRISNKAQFKGRQGVQDEIESILKGYGVDRLDLLMFHWPVAGHYEDTWKVICEAYDADKARSIGAANCHRHHLEKLMECGLKPMVNQFEVHPLFTQNDLVKYCQDLSIVVESYTAIARFDDRLMRLPALHRIAQSHGKSPAQIVLRWHVQRGCVPIVRSLNEVRQKEDVAIFDFQLSDEEMQTISGFNINSRLRYDPDNCDFSIL